MRARSAAILSLLAALALVAAILLGGPARGLTGLVPGTLACPGLTTATATAAAARIEVTHAGHTLTLARDGDTWTVPAQDGRAVHPGRAEALLAAMAATTLAEPRTADPARYTRLGVEDADAPNATSTLVRVLGSDDVAVAALVLGHVDPADHGGGMFVRRPGEQQTWLARSTVAASPEQADWLDMRLLDMSAEDIAKITVDSAAGTHLELTRAAETLSVTEPATHPKLDSYKVDDVARTVRAIDWSQARKMDALPGTPLGRTVVTTRGGQVVTLTVALDGTDGWLATDDAGNAGWAFRIPADRARALVPTIGDLVAYAPPPAPPPPPPPKSRK